jgi:hypothetical protein
MGWVRDGLGWEAEDRDQRACLSLDIGRDVPMWSGKIRI